MPTYRHKVNGVVVSLPDDHHVYLGSEWEEQGKPKESPTPRRRSKKQDDED